MNDAVSLHSIEAVRWESNYKKKEFALRKNVLHDLLADHDLGGQRWLDAGCGTGSLARLLAEEKGCHVLGVDASPEMISNCQPFPNTEYRRVPDLCETGLGDAAFDGVLCSSVIEYVASPPAALAEMRRLIKPNGLLLVSVPNSDLWAWWPALTLYWLTRGLGRWRLHRYLDYSKHRYSDAAFRRLLEGAGFRVEASRTYGGVRGFPALGHGTLMMFRAVRV